MATLVEWSDKYSVGCEKIDEQHKRLFDLINKLYQAFVEANAKKVITQIIEEMAKYAIYHFSTEEELFDKYDYYDKEKHKSEHELFIDKVIEFAQKLKNEELTVTYEVMLFLKDWLINHILKSDMRYKNVICK